MKGALIALFGVAIVGGAGVAIYYLHKPAAAPPTGRPQAPAPPPNPAPGRDDVDFFEKAALGIINIVQKTQSQDGN